MRTKSIEATLRDAERPGTRLNRALGPVQLTFIGIGVTVSHRCSAGRDGI